jgi:hypothetical protein
MPSVGFPFAAALRDIADNRRVACLAGILGALSVSAVERLTLRIGPGRAARRKRPRRQLIDRGPGSYEWRAKWRPMTIEAR